MLEGISLSLAPGRITALVGPNGTGKTTLIKIILGLTRPDAGRLLLDGEPVDADGRVPGAHRLRAAGAAPAGEPGGRRGLRDAARAAARRERRRDAGRGLRTPRRVGARGSGTLSGGWRQKLSNACAFLFAPDVLLLDEPTAGLDPISAGLLKAQLRTARADGRTVLISSHILSELEEIADDIAFLSDGHLRFSGPISALLEETGMRRLEPARRGAPARTARGAGRRGRAEGAAHEHRRARPARQRARPRPQPLAPRLRGALLGRHRGPLLLRRHGSRRWC